MESSHALSRDQGVISAPYAIRQFTIVNNTPSTIYINLGGTIPSAVSRQYIVQPYKTFTSPHINHSSIAYRYLSPSAPKDAYIIAYDQPVSGSGQSDHDPGIGEQCPSYPFAVITGYPFVWTDLPTIAPSLHRAVNFYIATEWFKGSTATLLALRFGTAPQRVPIYASGRAGAVSYIVPEIDGLRPSLYNAQPEGGDAPPDTITVDAYYSNSPFCWPFDTFNQHLVEPLPSIAALATLSSVFPLNKGYHQVSIYYAHSTAGGIVARTRASAFPNGISHLDATATLPTTAGALSQGPQLTVFAPVPQLLSVSVENQDAVNSITSALIQVTAL